MDAQWKSFIFMKNIYDPGNKNGIGKLCFYHALKEGHVKQSAVDTIQQLVDSLKKIVRQLKKIKN